MAKLQKYGVIVRWLVIVAVLLLSLGVSGCQEALAWAGAGLYQAQTKAPDTKTAARLVREGLKASPRIRVGYLPTTTLLTVFSDLDDLGEHGYRPNLSEDNGIVYTCRAGAIDTSHARKAADWTIFLAAKTFEKIMQDEDGFSYRLYEPSRYYVSLTYPKNWKEMSLKDRERIAYEISVGLGQYLAYTGITWHEIVTWFGFKSKGLEPEFPSAFTWEETFSNLFGTHITLLALADTEHTYNKAVTLAFERELRRLGIQSREVSRNASESVRGPWFTGDYYWITMKKRNFDLGLDDGFVTPALIPSVSQCEGAEPQSYPVPNLDVLSEHGFSIKYEIAPNMWEAGKILDAAYAGRTPRGNRVEPIIHYAPIMDCIRKDAIRRYGPGLQ